MEGQTCQIAQKILCQIILKVTDTPTSLGLCLGVITSFITCYNSATRNQDNVLEFMHVDVYGIYPYT